jgi:succinate-acetate transporter protein
MSQEILLKDNTANPAPIGLMGFGLTTLLLNLHNIGLFELNSMILAMGIFYGGFAQLIAGILESKKGNTFGMVAFVSYGSFWLTLVTLLVMPKLGLAEAPSAYAMGWYLTAWGVFTFILFLATLNKNGITQFIFFTLTVLFFLLAIADFTGSHTVKVVAGYTGIICALGAIYDAALQILNGHSAKQLISNLSLKRA